MTQEVILTQLYKSSEKEFIKGTCHVNDGEDGDRFECSIQGDRNYKAQLWQWVNGNWNGRHGIPCTIQFSEVTDRGLPTDAVIIKIHNFDPIEI